MTPKADKPLLDSPRKAGDLLDISERGVWRLIANGALPVVKIGRSTKIPRSAIEKLAGAE